MTLRGPGYGAAAAALIALLMLGYASVRSIVMQAEMAGAPTVMCGATMAGMAPGRTWTPPSAPGGKPAPASPATCAYCAAAGHLPILQGATRLRISTAFVFAAYREVASHGPRGPPSRQPRARGPPADPPHR